MNKLHVIYKGHIVFGLNASLVKKQNLTDEAVDYIKKLHIDRMMLEEAFMNKSLSNDKYVHLWEENQFALQDAWGFEPNKKMHRFWNMAGCTCPKDDNDERHPTGFYIISMNCPVHG